MKKKLLIGFLLLLPCAAIALEEVEEGFSFSCLECCKSPIKHSVRVMFERNKKVKRKIRKENSPDLADKLIDQRREKFTKCKAAAYCLGLGGMFLCDALCLRGVSHAALGGLFCVCVVDDCLCKEAWRELENQDQFILPVTMEK